MKKRIRSGVALLMSLMLIVQLCDGVIAWAVEDPTANIVLTTPEDLKDGNWFFIAQTEWSVSEKSADKLYIPVQRTGDLDKEASVELKLVDVTSHPGENYTASIYHEDAETETVLDGKPLVDIIADPDVQVEVDKEEYADASKEVLDQGGVLTDSENNPIGGIKSSESVENELARQDGEPEAGQTPETSDSAPAAEGEPPAAGQDALPAQTEETEPDGTEPVTVKKTVDAAAPGDVDASLLAYPTNPLRQARNEYVGTVSDRQDIVGDRSWINHSTAESYSDSDANLVTEDYPGTVYTLSFAAGEAVKFLVVDPIYSEKAQGDATLMLMLSAPSDGYLVPEFCTVTSVTIVDEDPPEEVVVSIQDTLIYAENGKAKVTVTRTGRTNDLVTVMISTQEGSGVTGQNFSGVGAKLYFSMGMSTRTVEIPVNHDATEKDFYVTITPVTDCTIGNGKARVIIPAENDGAALMDYDYLGIPLDYNYEPLTQENVHIVTWGDATGFVETGLQVNSGDASGMMMICLDPRQTNWDNPEPFTFFYDGVMMAWEQETGWFSSGDVHLFLSLKLNSHYEATGFGDMSNNHLNVPFKYSGPTVYNTHLESEEFSRRDYLFFWDEDYTGANSYGWREGMSARSVNIINNSNRNWRNTTVDAVRLIQRNFHFDLIPAEPLGLRGVSQADEDGMQTVKLNSSMTATSVDVLGGGSFAVTAANQKNLRFKAVEAVRIVDGQEVESKTIAEVPQGSNTVIIDVTMDLVDDLCYGGFCTLESNRKIQNTIDSYPNQDDSGIFAHGNSRQGVIKIRPVFEKIPVTVDVQPGTYGAFKGLETGEQTWYMGENLTLTTELNARGQAAGVEPTGVAVERRWSKSGEYIAKFDDYYLDENLTSTYEVDCPYMRVQPTFSSVGNTVSVRLSAADMELFDTTKGLFQNQTPVYSADTDTYTFTLADKVKISQIVNLMAVPKDLTMVPLWTTSRDRTSYSGYSFVFRAGATAEENALNLTLSKSGNEFYALSGTLYADELNLNTGGFTGVLSPAAEAMISAGASGVYAGEDGSFTVPAQRFAPGTVIRWAVTYNGGTDIQESALPASGAPTSSVQSADGSTVNAVNLDVGMKKVPNFSSLNAHFTGSYVTQSGVYVIGTSILELNGCKTILSAAVDPGVGYLDQNGNQQTENVTSVTFSFRDPRTGQTRSEIAAKYDGVSKTWQADLGRFAPEDMEGTCTYGDLVYVQMTTDRDPTGSGGGISYAPVSTGYAVISSQEVAPGTTFEMDLPINDLMSSFTDSDADLSADGSHTSASFKSLPFLGEIKAFIGVAKTVTKAWKAIAARGEQETADMVRQDLEDLADNNDSLVISGDNGGASLMDGGMAGGVQFNLIIDFKELPYGGTRVLLGALISVGNTTYQRMTNPYASFGTVISGTATRGDPDSVDYGNMQQIGDDGIVRIQNDLPLVGNLSGISKSNKNWMGGWYFAFGIYAGVYMDFGLMTKTVTSDGGNKNVTTEFKIMGAGGFTGVMGKAGGVIPCAFFPIYFGIEGSADVKVFFGQTGDPNITLEAFKDGKEVSTDDWTFNVDSEIKVKGMGYVGLGIPGILGVKASVGVQIRFTNGNKLPQWFPNNPDMAYGKGMGTDAIFEGTVDLVLLSLPLFTYSFPMPLEGGSVPYFREINKARKVESILLERMESSSLSDAQKADLRKDLQHLEDVIHDNTHSSEKPIAEASMKVWDKGLTLGLLTESEHHVYYTFAFEGRAGGIIGNLLGDESGSARHDYYVQDYGASRWVANDGTSLMASFKQADSKTILEDTVNQPEPQLLDLGNGQVLMAFLDVDANRPAGHQSVLKVSLLDTGSGRWSTPVTVQGDGTGDFAPNLCDCGEAGVMLSWVSTAPDKVKEEEDPLDTLAQLDVFSVMLDRNGEVVGSAEQLTDDDFRDYNPQGIYDPSTGDRMVMYIKTSPGLDYEAESDAQKFFDYANPYAGNNVYSVTCYMLYNNQTNAPDNNGVRHEAGWAKDYYFANEKASIDQSFLEYWGGQRFLASPIKDEAGNVDMEDPPIGDLTTCIAANGVASFAYSVDMDMDSGTWNDKELFIQFYDFQEHTVFVPVRLTMDSLSQTTPQLVRTGGQTRLFFLSDMDSMYYLNISQMLNATVATSETDPTPQSALRDDGTFADGYSPAFRLVEAGGTNSGDLGKITGYTAYVDKDDNLYVVYPATLQYTDEIGNVQCAQELFAIGFIDEKFTGEEGGVPRWSAPAQLTTGYKCNSEPAVTTDSSGNLILVHNQYEMIDRSTDDEWLADHATIVVETDANGNETEVVKTPFREVTPTDLVMTMCAPVGSLACTKVEYSDSTPEPGDEIDVSALLQNTGLTSVRKGHVDVYEYVDGRKGEKINGGTYDVEELMQPNTFDTYDFKWKVPDDAETLAKTSLLFEITEYDQYGNKYDTLRFVNGAFTLQTDLSARVNSIQQQGDVYQVEYSVTNSGNLPADPMYVRLSLSGLYGDLKTDYGVTDPELCGEDLDSLAPGETKTYSKTVTVPSSVFELCGYDAVTPELTDPADHENVIFTGSSEYITQEEPFHVKVNDGQAIALTVGQTKVLDVSYELNAVADQGTTAVWSVSDPSVATVQDGKLVALGDGSAILTATLMPYGVNASVPVTVTGGGSASEGGGGGGGTPAAPADNTPVNATVTGDSGSVEVTATVKDDTATIEAPTQEQMDRIIGDNETDNAVIDLSSLPKTVTAVNIPAETVEAFQSAQSTNGKAMGMQVQLPAASVTFDAAAMDSISEQLSGKDLKVSVDAVDAADLNSLQQQALEGLGVQAVYDVTVTSGDKAITDLGDGSVTVQVPYGLKDGQKPAGLQVFTTDKDGNLTEVDCRYENGKLTYSTDDPSKCIVVYSAEKAAQDVSACPKDATCPISRFSDAKPDAWYHDGVHWALNEGIMNGTSDTTFAPNGSATRAMVVTMLWRMAGEPAAPASSGFDDVSDGAWYADAVAWAAENDTVNGISETDFAPDTPVTREQLAAILYRYAQAQGKGFTGTWAFPLDFSDAADVSDYAYEPMCWMTMNGVITGMGNGALAPKDNATRAQIATMFMRFEDVMAK